MRRSDHKCSAANVQSKSKTTAQPAAANIPWLVSLGQWAAEHRDPATGLLQVNRTRFPHGMAWLGEHIHRLGLKFGTYGALGYAQCCSGHADPNATDGSGPGCNKDRDHQVCRNETFFDRDAELWAGECKYLCVCVCCSAAP